MDELISIVIPVFNEELVLDELHGRLTRLMDGHGLNCEVILVNDGSRDGTLGKIKRICSADRRFKLLGFSRNFGHQMAITAGIDRARGAAIVIMDADLQDPPEVIVEMIEKWRAGYQVVYGVRSLRRGESRFKLATASLFYRVLRRLTEVEIPADAGDFRLLDRRVADTLVGMRERARFMRGMVSWVGFRQTGLEYVREERFAGETKYPLAKMVRFAIDGILGFSRLPLKAASVFGLICSGVSVLYILYALGVKYVDPSRGVPGWASLFVAVLFVSGVQLICLGIIGEYLGRIYDEIKGRPLYVCAEEMNFDE
ncbi:MAG: glycosyltransferase family 2 protein [Candidatus Eisenbacteria bacterium]